MPSNRKEGRQSPIKPNFLTMIDARDFAKLKIVYTDSRAVVSIG